MIIDYRRDSATPNVRTHRVVDATTGEPLGDGPDESIFYADDAAGVYRAYLLRPAPRGGRPRPYLRHRITHFVLPEDRTIFEGDRDQHDWEIATVEHHRPIRIVPRGSAA